MDSLIRQIAHAGVSFQCEPFVLRFKKPSGTSRGILTEKLGWKLIASNGITKGMGECSVIPGLSPDFSTVEAYENHLDQFCSDPKLWLQTNDISQFPSILFGIESALSDFNLGGKQIYFDVFNFPHASIDLPINGLVWMGDYANMHAQIQEKLIQGFSCIKLKVGAIDFGQEIALIQEIRTNYSAKEITIRVDANGAFQEDEALFKLEQLAHLDVHSIEQPIRQGNWSAMANLCASTPLPIALDEELIGVCERDKMAHLLSEICPQYIILKPSLHGGISGTQQWIQEAEKRNIPWWITSALESNIGLNVIAQLAQTYTPSIPQGLGTGGLYEENFPTKLYIENGHLRGPLFE